MVRATACAFLLLLVTAHSTAAAMRFEIRLGEAAVDQAVSGRLFVFTSKVRNVEPIRALNWFRPEPFFAVEVRDLAPGKTIVIDEQADGFPGKLSTLPAGEYRLQAILDRDFDHPAPADGPGNIYSDVVVTQLDPATTEAISLEIQHLVPTPERKDTDSIKFLAPRSQLLSEFHQRDVMDRAVVVLPKSYAEHPQRRYPVCVEISGFGDSQDAILRRSLVRSLAVDGDIEFIRVLLTGECKWGHHVYANSSTNGPRGDALVHELIPYIDAQFRTVADPRARFVSGHSSGGWSSLWLQVQYPATFGGVWSTSPDPVDFRDWQGTDLYARPPQSVFTDPAGTRRPLARVGRQVLLWYDHFNKMDDVLGRGGQLRSFDAVFSPRQPDGEPAHCWDRVTGVVDPAVVEHWKRYDISLILQDRWPALRENLAGKIRITMGELDNFYLEGATIKLAERLKELGSDARIEIIPGAGHQLPPQVDLQRESEMATEFLKHFDRDGQPL